MSARLVIKPFFLAILIAFNWAHSQTQIGADFDGEAALDYSGYSVSMSDKETIAIGAIQNDGSASNAGHVRIFKWNGTSWIQKGSDIDGEAANDNFGISVSFPDSNYVAIGAYRNDGTGSNAGHVRVFRWNGSTWQQQGNDIDGETIGDESGKSISQ